MWSRIVFGLITIFFVVMNVLLWQAEIAGRGNIGSSVPPEIVWKKILTAPDPSPLEIRHHGQKIGNARWVPTVGEQVRRGRHNQLPPEGMVKAVSNYSLECEGQIALSEREHVGFNLDITLGTNYAWQQFDLRLTLRPQVWELHSVASNKTLRFVSTEGNDRSERVFTFDDLANPEKIVREFAGPWVPASVLTGILPFGMTANASSIASSIDWHARSDSLHLGAARVRGYRLQAKLLGRLEASIFINTLGEVVRIELPDQFLIINEGLSSL